ATLAQRQFNRVDPDNRLVAAELEARWEAALRELKQAEESAAQADQVVVVPFALTAELKAAFTANRAALDHDRNQSGAVPDLSGRLWSDYEGIAEGRLRPDPNKQSDSLVAHTLSYA